MMRKKKRIPAMLLLLALLFPLCAAFAGCGEEQTDGEETSSETSESGEPSGDQSEAVSDGKTDAARMSAVPWSASRRRSGTRESSVP